MNSGDSHIPLGFEIRYLLTGHDKGINYVVWSPDGRSLASCSNDRTIRLWDIDTGKLICTLVGHTDWVLCAAWSPDGKTLASGSDDNTIRIWDVKTSQLLHVLKNHTSWVRSLAWSPDGLTLASGSGDHTIQIWNTKTWQLSKVLTKGLGGTETSAVRSLAWSLDGQTLASAHGGSIYTWNTATWQIKQSFRGHEGWVFHIAWSPDGETLASGSADKTVRFWDTKTGQPLRTFEAHTGRITSLSFSFDGRLIASKSEDGTIQFWRLDTGENIINLNEPLINLSYASLAFNPKLPQLASMDKNDTAIRIWDFDLNTIFETYSLAIPSAFYRNAKVVLLGDTGVGKTALSLVLTDQPFVPTESTHGRHVWVFDSQEVIIEDGLKERHEIMLWDLAGQPGYRLVHQLHLNDVAVAIVVFDARSETDPFAGVNYWDRALRQAQRVQGNSIHNMKRFLVSARMDREGRGVSRTRIDSLMQELDFDEYFETSAKDGLKIKEFAQAIKEAIDWKILPIVSSTLLFQHIKAFLTAEAETGRQLSTVDDLYRSFIIQELTRIIRNVLSRNTLSANQELLPKLGSVVFLEQVRASLETKQRWGYELPTADELYHELLTTEDVVTQIENLRAQFETCVGRVESRGIVRQLSFGKLILLQPEILDAYASALINAVKDEPDGLGSIIEEKARLGEFRMPEDAGIKDKEQEKLLLIAMIEDLLRRELALREGPFLVFPSQSTRENPNLVDPEGSTVVFNFEGSVQSIYATLAVRLSHSGVFEKDEVWRNAVTYKTVLGGTHGILLHTIQEGKGELTLFFNKAVGEQTKSIFEEYIKEHLQQRALPDSISRRRIFVCSGCGTPLSDLSVKRRLERNYDWMNCGVCDTVVSLLDEEDSLSSASILLGKERSARAKQERTSYIVAMNRAADTQRELSVAASTLQGKIATRDFDVFLCYKSEDKFAVKDIGERLKERGILPWLDEWELRPGTPWQQLLEKQIRQIKSVAVFVGKKGVGPWQKMEIDAFLREFVNRRCPVIPVLLPDARKRPQLPIFLNAMTWVDFHQSEYDPIERLIWGITGIRK